MGHAIVLVVPLQEGGLTWPKITFSINRLQLRVGEELKLLQSPNDNIWARWRACARVGTFHMCLGVKWVVVSTVLHTHTHTHYNLSLTTKICFGPKHTHTLTGPQQAAGELHTPNNETLKKEMMPLQGGLLADFFRKSFPPVILLISSFPYFLSSASPSLFLHLR